MPSGNYGICTNCRQPVPVEHEVRDGQVFLKKHCPDCGPTEALVSSDAAAWERKRLLYRYAPPHGGSCALRCTACSHSQTVRMAFVDVTNHCNMNCPICVANVPSMRFEFHPPLIYFEKLFAGLALMDPKPAVHLFGGEPTMRDDLLDIIDLAHRAGLLCLLVTNGLKLADEDYCRTICEKEVPVLLGFDGTDPEVYRRLRKNSAACGKKLEALENLKKHSRRRTNILMCCVARNVNDQHIGDLIRLCHEHRSHIKGLYFLPLVETWVQDEFKTNVTTTIEDVEHIVNEAFPGEPVEFLSLGLQHYLNPALGFLRASLAQTFPSVHPNCESATKLLSDGKRYRPLSHYLKRPLSEVAVELTLRARELDEKLSRLDPHRSLQGLYGRLAVLKAFSRPIVRSARLDRITRGQPLIAFLRLAGGLLAGKPLGEQLKKHTLISDGLTLMVLPFEEIHSLESERLERCSSAFAYLDPDTEDVRTIPACAWWLYNTQILQQIVARYGKPQPAASQPVLA